MCTTRTLISQQTQLGLFSLNAATSERIHLQLNYLTSVQVCMHSEPTLNAPTEKRTRVSTLTMSALKEEAFSDVIVAKLSITF